jgi:hypothetical protein
MTMTRTGRLGALALGLSLAAAIPNAAMASTPRIDDQFAAAVLTCEDRTARGSLGDLRDCVRGLAVPDPTDAEIMDLWSIFMYCLSFMSEDGLDAMYPSSHYEDKVNDCLGL